MAAFVLRGRFQLGSMIAWSILGLTAQRAAAQAPILISEFRTQGPGGQFDEFIELYNPGAQTVSVGGWYVRSSSSMIQTGLSGSIPSHRHMLLASLNYTGPFPDIDFTMSMAANGGIALFNSNDDIVDQVGMGTGVYHEGTPLPVYSVNEDWAYERKPGGAAGNSTDTDNNNSDFRLIRPSNPQTLDSPPTPSDCNPCDTNCDGSVNQFDIQPFVQSLLSHTHSCGSCAADTNGDGSMNQFDIQGFVDCLTH